MLDNFAAQTRPCEQRQFPSPISSALLRLRLHSRETGYNNEPLLYVVQPE